MPDQPAAPRQTVPPPLGAPGGPRMACPACGVAVTPGYIKCPRCHAGLPRMPRAGRMTAGGGTAVETAAPVPWVPIVVGVAVVGAAVAWLALRSGAAPAAPAPVAPTPTAIEPVAPAPPPAVVPEVAPTVTAPGADVRAARTQAVAALEASLKSSRLWSKLEVAGTSVRITSALCGEAGMSAAVDAARAQLKAGDIVRVECRAGHGGLEWARDL